MTQHNPSQYLMVHRGELVQYFAPRIRYDFVTGPLTRFSVNCCNSLHATRRDLPRGLFFPWVLFRHGYEERQW